MESGFVELFTWFIAIITYISHNKVLFIILVAFLYIFYYFQLYKKTKLSGVLLICDIVTKLIMFIMDKGIDSYGDLSHYILLLLSIALYFTEGLVAKIILGILSSFIFVSLVMLYIKY